MTRKDVRLTIQMIDVALGRATWGKCSPLPGIFLSMAQNCPYNDQWAAIMLFGYAGCVGEVTES